MIDGEHAVEVIHLMLDQLGEGVHGFKAVARAGGVIMFNDDTRVAAEVDHEIGEREAVVPNLEGFSALLQIRGIDELVAASIHVEEDDAEGLADLDGADAAAEAVAAAEIGEGVFEIREDAPRFRRIPGGSGDEAQGGMAEFEDAAHGHAFIVRQERRRQGSDKLGLMPAAGRAQGWKGSGSGAQ